MDTVGASEAQTHLSDLLDRVARGEIIQITRRGRPVTRLTPSAAAQARELNRNAAEIRELRKDKKLGRVSLRTPIGRR